MQAYNEAAASFEVARPPNGYLHIGHAKSICLNFGVAQSSAARATCASTTPTRPRRTSSTSSRSGGRPLARGSTGATLFYASDYFEQLYEWAEQLIAKGKAYVDDLTADEIREYRGTLTEPGRNSPYRDRPVEENLDLFRRMRAGRVPRRRARAAREDRHGVAQHQHARPGAVPHPHAHHPPHRRRLVHLPDVRLRASASDAIEGITHSICTLEFEDHRPLYDWFIEQPAASAAAPQQIEFARLNLTYTVMSKRKLLQLVNEEHVTGWDDPRMPTIAGMRRRGYTPEAIRDFCDAIGVAKNENVIDVALLEHACART